jgi:UDP-N-acetylglucosamine 1-carboxyvinyltransferase
LTAVTDTLRACGYGVGGTKGTLTIRANGIPEPLDLKTRPYPGFPTDLQAQMCALLSTAAGESSVTEDIFPQRVMHVSELKRMGAKIELNGATAKIRGVDNLSGH